MHTATRSLLKKIFIGVFLFSLSFFPNDTKEASAAGPVPDVVLDPINLIENIASVGVSLTSLSWETVGKSLLEQVAFQASKAFLDKITENTISWIRGGFHGSPSFAVDTNQIFTEIADSIAGGMVLSLRNVSVCEFSANYKDDLINSVDLSVKKRPYLYNQQATCPFNETVNFKASDFYNNFSNGGWGMMGAALNDGGNPYGLQLLTAKEQASREMKATAEKDKKLGWSNGFTDIIDTTDCNYPAELFAIPNDPADPSTGAFDDTLPLVTQAQADEQNQAIWSDPTIVKNIQAQFCKTATPGKIVSDQLTKTLEIDMDRIGLADNMNKILGAFFDTLTQETVRSVFGKDKSTLGGGRTPPAKSIPSIPVTVTTSPATKITQTSATLNGFISYTGAEKKVRVWFILGEDSKKGDLLPASVPTSLIGQAFSSNIIGLKPNTTYFVNVVATTGGTLPKNPPENEILGTQFSFETLP